MAPSDSISRMTLFTKTSVFFVFLLWTCVHFSSAYSATVQTNNASGTVNPSVGSGTSAGSSRPGGTEEETPLEKGIQPLFIITNFFLDKIVQPNVEVEGSFNESILSIVSGSVGAPNFGQIGGQIGSEWQKYTLHYIGFVICFALGIAFMIVMPIVGLCFCCCRLCGNCGGRASPEESKHAKCKRITFGACLFIVTTFMLAATVCAFVTNELIHHQTSDKETGVIANIDQNLKGVQNYLNSTNQELSTGVLTTFDKTSNEILQKIDSIAQGVLDQIGNETKAKPLLESAKNFAAAIPKVKSDLLEVKGLVEKLKANSTTLENALGTQKTNVLAALQSCPSTTCDGVKSKAANLEVNIDFAQIDSLIASTDSVIDSLTKVENTNLAQLIADGEASFNSIKANISGDIDAKIQEANKTVADLRLTIKEKLDTFLSQLGEKSNDIQGIRGTVRNYQPKVKEFGNYIMYAGIGLSCVLLLVVLFNYLGLMFGACGERPYEDARICNKGVGANFLMAGVGFTFIFCWLLMLLTSILFLVGGMLETEACRHLVDPIHSKRIQNIGNQLNLGQFLYGNASEALNVSKVFSDCEQNVAVYTALQLDKLVDVGKVVNDNIGQIDEKVQEIADQINSTDIGHVTLVSSATTDELDRLKASNYSNINFTGSLDQLNEGLLKIDLDSFIRSLEGLRNKGANDTALNSTISELSDLKNSLIKSMTDDINQLKLKMTELSKTNLTTQAENLLDGLRNAENSINNNAASLISKAAGTTADFVQGTITKSASQIVNELETNIGRCRPLYDSAMGLINSGCKKMLYPVNGFWFAFGWCLFFFIPSIILSVKLAGIYRKIDKYVSKDADDVDTNNYHGIYPGDNIPLNEMRNNPKHYRDGRGLQNTGYDGNRERGQPVRSRDDYYDQRNGGYPTPNPDHQRGGYGRDEGLRVNPGYPDEYYPRSRPPSYSAPSPHWQK